MMRDTFLDELTKLAEEDSNIILITGDLGFGVLEKFAKTLPKQFLNVGVAEQNMAMVAAGMAMEGKKVYTYSIANFPTLRCLEQIRNDICYHDLDVTIVSIGGGFSYGQLGMSHHATEDLSILRSLPNLTITAPSSKKEVREVTQALYKEKGPSYIRLDKSSTEILDKSPVFSPGKSSLIKEGEALTIIACGGILEEAIKASKILEEDNIYCRILSMHTIKPLDTESIRLAALETGGIITIEENSIIGGLGGAVSEYCLESGNVPKFFLRIGMDDKYSSVVGDQYYLRKHYSMDSESVVRSVKNLIS